MAFGKGTIRTVQRTVFGTVNFTARAKGVVLSQSQRKTKGQQLQGNS